MDTIIASLANPKIKWVKGLHKNSSRRKEGVFLVEGAKEIASALSGGYIPRHVFVCPEIYAEELVLKGVAPRIHTVNREVFQKITYRGSSDGILAIFDATQKTLDDLELGNTPSFIIVEGIEKPGNLGAIIRSADGADIDAVIVCNSTCDIFNPNVIRASLGTVFTKQVVTASNEQVSDFLAKHEITTYSALLSERSSAYTAVDFTIPTAIVLGTEHDGLSEFWQQRSIPVVIPMRGSNDSLNVSNAAAILAYEIVRQRDLLT
ncbi:MAG: RNA methyltransferase [Candidatus Saccharimonadales bacterium]